MVFDPDTGLWFTGLGTSAEIPDIEPADVDAITRCRFLGGLPTPNFDAASHAAVWSRWASGAARNPIDDFPPR